MPFVSRLDAGGKTLEFFKTTNDATAGEKSATSAWALLDTTTGSEWNFQGCATSGPAQGRCLQPVYVLKEFWFDWKLYHPATTLYKH
ncbi:MAG: DUF3179 domain-containing (seleno)protein [Terriglobales bacterium]